MFAHAFRFDPTRLRAAFAPRKPRHPLLRLAAGLLGLGLLLLLVFFSVFVGVAMLAGGVLYRLAKQRGKPVLSRTEGPIAQPARVMDGEFRRVGKPVLPSA